MCVRSGATLPPATVPRTLVAHGAWAGEKDFFSVDGFRSGRFRCRFPLQIEPRLVFIRFLCDDQQSHVGVLSTAILRALSLELPRVAGLDADVIWVTWNQVHLPMQSGDPEGMDHVLRFQFQRYWTVHGNMDFIGGGRLNDRG